MFSVVEFEDHFFDDTDMLDFDELELPNEVVVLIEECVAEARELTQKADCFGEKQKRSTLHSLAKVENELRKEKTNLEAVYEIAYKGADILERYGEAAKPIANAISAIRSKTILKSEGQKAIEAEEKPKQIEDKSKD